MPIKISIDKDVGVIEITKYTISSKKHPRDYHEFLNYDILLQNTTLRYVLYHAAEILKTILDEWGSHYLSQQ
jgi:hypothetical protein